MNDIKSILRLVVNEPMATQREEDRRAEAIIRRLVLAVDEEGYEAAFKEFIAWAHEADPKVVK